MAYDTLETFYITQRILILTNQLQILIIDIN